jgi:hypothetical protein
VADFLYGNATQDIASALELVTVPRREIVVDLTNSDREGKWVDRSPWVEELGRLFSEHFGGSFSYEGVGRYVAVDGVPILEETTRTQTFGTVEEIRAALPRLLGFLLRYAEGTNQETVLLCMNGHPHFLSSDELREWCERKEGRDD